MKKSLVFILFMCLFVKLSYAHNPLSAMYYLEVEDDFGILNISLSQAGLQEALFKAFPNEKFDDLSEIEYKLVIVKYIKDKFHLTVNNRTIALLDGGVKLGNHQTDLKFITAKLPETFNTLIAKIDAFKENEHHQTIFSLALHGKTSKVILNENNHYSTTVNFVDNKMIANASHFEQNYLWFLIIVPVLYVVKKVIPNKNLSA